MLKLNLTTWQRLMCIQALNGQTGHISAVRKALRLLEILELNEEERVAVELRELQPGQYIWTDTQRRFELEIKDRELAAFLRRAVGAYGQWPVNQARQVADLFEQLGIEEEPAGEPVPGGIGADGGGGGTEGAERRAGRGQ